MSWEKIKRQFVYSLQKVFESNLLSSIYKLFFCNDVWNTKILLIKKFDPHEISEILESKYDPYNP